MKEDEGKLCVLAENADHRAMNGRQAETWYELSSQLV